jgi:flagellar basal-body rod modification protein FlgD
MEENMDYSVQAQNSSSAQNQAASSSANKTASSLGKDEFLKLLMTQLKYQDPMSPMDDKSFIAQMAQFNTLEQQVQLNDTLTKNQGFEQLSAASNLIGKTVNIQTKDKDDQVVSTTGMVQQLKRDSDGVKVMVNNTFYDVNDVFEVANA